MHSEQVEDILHHCMQKLLRSFSSFFLDLTETLVIGLSFFLVVYLFFLQPHQVNGHSMDHTFENGDFLLTDKVSYRVGDPKRGDIVVFHAPESANCPTGTGCDFIKRVIGLPGDTIQVRDNHIFLNGQLLKESYLPPDLVTEPGAFTRNKTIVVGPGEYFVCGDNRPGSSDSRAWGTVPKENIVGRAFFRYWPMSTAGWIEGATY